MGLALQRESMLGDNLKRRATREGLVSGTPSFFKLVCFLIPTVLRDAKFLF
ncbi:hypothetical protein JHK86_042580 [Glycine max]|nr:hypothetical protein JHK86_042580 [Glycine max]